MKTLSESFFFAIFSVIFERVRRKYFNTNKKSILIIFTNFTPHLRHICNNCKCSIKCYIRITRTYTQCSMHKSI